MGPDPLQLGTMGRGIKIGWSRGPKWRPDPLLGPFLVILSHFDHLGGGNSEPVDPDGVSKLVGPEGPSGVQTLFWGHFWPFWAFFLTLFGYLGGGQWLQVGPPYGNRQTAATSDRR